MLQWWCWFSSTNTKFSLSDLKNDNTWFTLNSCSCAHKACQEDFQAYYSFGNLGGYKGFYCIKYYET